MTAVGFPPLIIISGLFAFVVLSLKSTSLSAIDLKRRD
jgi:hypothetical protein